MVSAIPIVLSWMLVGWYWSSARVAGYQGFPLDDAYIHQQIARNFALSHELRFNRDEPVAVSTSPIWTLMVAAGYSLNLNPIWWTVSLGLFWLAVLLGVAFGISLKISKGDWWFAFLSTTVLAVEWHLVWLALSGMETLMFSAMLLAVWGLMLRTQNRTWALLATVAPALVRPEGSLLAGAVALAASRNRFKRDRWWFTPVLLVGGALVGLFAVLWLLQGAIFPSTFAAKAFQYHGSRLAFLSAMVLLIPPVLWPFALRAWFLLFRRAEWFPVALWVLFHGGLFAVILPATYHRDRYLVPILPIMVLAANYSLWTWTRVRRFRTIIIGCVILYEIGIVQTFRSVYVQDVTCISRMQLAIGDWLRARCPDGCYIALDDIGAIAYRSGCKVYDLRGLATPAAVPLLHDKTNLLTHAIAQGVGFVALYPEFYPSLDRFPVAEVATFSLRSNTICAGSVMVLYQVDNRRSQNQGDN